MSNFISEITRKRKSITTIEITLRYNFKRKNLLVILRSKK